MLGTTDTMKFTYTKTFQDFSVFLSDYQGGGSNVNQQRKATSYCKDGTSTLPARAKCASISGPLQWCKISDAKKFTNGLISDDKGIPIDTNCKADPCTNKDDGATCCEDMTKKESLGTGTGPSSANESDGTKVTLGMMSTALSALAVVYATTY